MKKLDFLPDLSFVDVLLCGVQRAKDSKVSKVTREMLGERDEKIQHLEEVNKTLKMANDEMREEVANLKAQLVTMTREVRGQDGREGREKTKMEGRRQRGRSKEGARLLVVGVEIR